MNKLRLEGVTLCAAASVNVAATLMALRRCLDQVEFGSCLFFTDARIDPQDNRVKIISIAKLNSATAYSRFILKKLPDYIETDHVLIVQWDGFIANAGAWDPDFLTWDYIGAPWPQFDDGHDVGNGGFSLRSRRLLQACTDANFRFEHPEDVAICRINRPFLEREFGIRFCDKETAERFATERTGMSQRSFGFHGIFNMIPVLGIDGFWKLYRSLDDRKTAAVDYQTLLQQIVGPGALARRLRLTADIIRQRFG